MDQIDKRILDIIQSGFPIAPRPYAEIGAQVGLTESEALARVRALTAKGVIRRMGASFQSKGLGYKSTLCAAKVPEDKNRRIRGLRERELGCDPQLLARKRVQYLVHLHRPEHGVY